MNEIKFSQTTSTFYKSIQAEIKFLLEKKNVLHKAQILLWTKFIFYFSCFIFSYSSLFLFEHTSFISILLNYIAIGISGIFLAFNVAHDACHDTLSKYKRLNNIIFQLTFNLQGTNAYLWKIRHQDSHHLFPNVDGCDADIDNNPFMRLSPQHPLKKHQKFQHIYAFFIYCIYTLHWFFIKDFMYLKKKKLANLNDIKHPIQEWNLFFFWKSLYLYLIIFLPIQFGYSIIHIIYGFLIMQIINSLLFIHTLIITHLCLETEFPQANENGILPYDFFEHQLATSLDYHPTSQVATWFFGGFNAHAAHHLFPNLPHTIYPKITQIIQENVLKYNLKYNQLSFINAIKSHYLYLKKMGQK